MLHMLHPKLINFTKNILRSSLGELINKASLFFLNIIIIQQLGQQQFGQISIIMSIVFLIGIISDAGINRLMIRDTPLQSSALPTYLLQSLILKTIVFLICLGMFSVARPSSETWLVMISYLRFGYSSSLIDGVRNALRSRQQMKQESILKIRQTAIIALPTLLIIWQYQTIGLTQLAYTYLISGLLSLIVGGRLTYHISRHLTITTTTRGLLYSIRQGSPFLCGALLTYCYGESSLFIIQHLAGDAAVGSYAVGYRIMIYMSLIMDIITQAAFKQLSDEYHHRNSYRSMYLVLAGLLGITISRHLLTIVGVNRIIPTLYGREFASSGGLLVGFSFVSIITAVNFVYGTLLTIQHHNRDRVVVQIIVALSHIIATRYGLLRYGLYGAVGGLVVSQSIMAIGYMILFYHGVAFGQRNQ